MKIKDLIFNREKLRKYEELKEWRGNFADMVDIPTWNMMMFGVNSKSVIALPLPNHIKQIIVDALEAEIKKLDEE